MRRAEARGMKCNAMILYDRQGNKYHALKSKRPLMRHHRGRTWDYDLKSIDGVEREFWYDTTWGRHFYFKIGEEWFSLRHYSDIFKNGPQWDNCFDVQKFYTTIPEHSA